MTAFTVVMLRKLVSVVVTLPLDPVSLSLKRKITKCSDCSCLLLENSHELWYRHFPFTSNQYHRFVLCVSLAISNSFILEGRNCVEQAK